MKKYIYFFLAVVAISFCGCIATTDDIFAIRDFNGPRLMLVNYPAKSNNYILGAGNPQENRVDFVFRDCFTNEFISCSDSLGNIEDYIILFLGEGYNDDHSFETNNLYKEDGDEYYVKIYLAQHKKIDYKEQQSNPLNYLDTIEFDIDYNAGMIQYITIKDDNQWVWYKGKRIPSYRILQFWPYKI